METCFREQEFTVRSLVFMGGQVVYRCNNADKLGEDIVNEHMDVINGDIREIGTA